MDDDEQRFAEAFLHALDTFEALDRNLVEIGMSGCREMAELRRALIAHGAETYRGMTVHDKD